MVAANNSGGGVSLRDFSASITKCTFKSNTAVSAGGVLSASYSQTGAMSLKLTASTFDGNTVSVGGLLFHATKCRQVRPSDIGCLCTSPTASSISPLFLPQAGLGGAVMVKSEAPNGVVVQMLSSKFLGSQVRGN